MSGQPPRDPPAGPRLEKGASIGRYVVLGRVGRGAMSEVYAAWDPELDRKVAVKLLRPEGGTFEDSDGGGGGGGGLSAAETQEAKSRLLREAQAIARLSHPNVVVVHDVGSFEDQVFVAMEYVDGNTVYHWHTSAPRRWQEILRIFKAAGRGLAAAHAANLVHRDFKAENVMLTADGQVRVMDFGLARRIAEPAVAGRNVAAPAPEPGSPGTAAISPDAGGSVESTRRLPAQRACAVGETFDLAARGRPGQIRTPIDALEMSQPGLPVGAGADRLATNLTQSGAIVGTPAYMAPEQFQGHAADARSDQFSFCVALYEALYGERPFAGRTVGQISRAVLAGRMRAAPETTHVPGWLRRVVLRGLATAPAARWASMDGLLAALDSSPRARTWWYAAAAGAALAAVVVALLVASRPDHDRPTCDPGAGRFAGLWEPPGQEGRRAAIAASIRRSGKPYAEESFAGVAKRLDAYAAGWSAMYRDACEATTVRGEQSGEVLDLRMACLRDRWNELRALSDVLVGGQDVVVTNAIAAATALTPIDRCGDVSALRASLAPPADPETRRKVAVLRDRLVACKALQDAGRYTRALEDAMQVVSEARALRHRPLIAEALNRLAQLQLDTGHPREAAATFDEAVFLAQATSHDELVTEVATAQIYVAGYLERDMARARLWMSHARAFLDRIGGHELLRAWMLNNVGVVLDADGQYEEAATEFSKALQIKERVLGKDHPDVSYTLANLAYTLASLGRPLEALEQSDRSVGIIGRVFGEEHPDMAVQLVSRAEILNQLGRYQAARGDAGRAVGIQERELGPACVNLIFALAPLGDAELGLGQPAQAVEPLERALQLAEAAGLADELPRLRFALARALWESARDRPRARQLAESVAGPRPPTTKAAGLGPAAGGGSERPLSVVVTKVSAKSDDKIEKIQRQASSWLSSLSPPRSPSLPRRSN
jgi:eukaryotic-like serine/threonine-protein kinase